MYNTVSSREGLFYLNKVERGHLIEQTIMLAKGTLKYTVKLR